MEKSHLRKDASLPPSFMEDPLFLKAKTISREGWYTTADIMKLFQLSRSTIYRLRRRGDIPHFKLGGTYVYPRTLTNKLYLAKSKQNL